MPIDSTLAQILDSAPEDTSGRLSRRGYRYQDLCALRYLVTFAQTHAWHEVWCESHDDIVLYRHDDEGETFRFVQVKHRENAKKHWSSADLCRKQANERGSTTTASSILEKLFSQARFEGNCDFRLATNEGVDSELRPFHYRWGKPEPAIDLDCPGANSITNRMAEWADPNSRDLAWYISRFAIEQHTTDANELEILIRSEIQGIAANDNIKLFGDELDALFQQLFMCVYNATIADADADLTEHPERLNASDFKKNVLALAQREIQYTNSLPDDDDGDRLSQELLDAGLDDVYYQQANELRLNYKVEELRHRGSERGRLLHTTFNEVVARCLVRSLHAKQGTIKYGIPLLTTVLDDMDQLSKSAVSEGEAISPSLMHGMCYHLIGKGRFRLIA